MDLGQKTKDKLATEDETTDAHSLLDLIKENMEIWEEIMEDEKLAEREEDGAIKIGESVPGEEKAKEENKDKK